MTDEHDIPDQDIEDTARIDEALIASASSPTPSGNPHVDALALDFGPRPAGSAAESEAADYLKFAFGREGAPAARLTSRVPRFGELLDLGIAAATLVSVLVALVIPPLGLVLFLTLLGIALADVYGYVKLSRWLPTRDSVNVLSIVPPTETEIRRLIVTATLDTGKVGLLTRRQMGHLYRWSHVVILVAQALGVLLSIAALTRDDTAIRPLFAIPALLLIVTIVVLAEREWGSKRYSPGAISNASGIAALVDLAGRTVQKPPQWLEVWFLGLGASSAPGGGIADFLARNTFDPDITYFIHLQSPGGGTLTAPKTSGAGLRTAPATPLLTWILDSVRTENTETPVKERNRLPVASQAHATHRAGYQSIVVAGVDETGRIPFLDDAEDLPFQVRLEGIDETVSLLGDAIDALDREVAARAMLARSTATVQGEVDEPLPEDAPEDEE